MLSALKRIQSRSRATAQKFATHAPATTEKTCPFSVGDLVLPIPEPLTTQLVTLGIDEPSAQRISSVMMQTVLCLKQSCESDFKRRRDVLQAQAHYFQDPKSKSLVPATYLVIYNQAIRCYTKYLLEEFTPRVLKARSLQHESRPHSLASKHCRRPFNQSALPVLEGFFDENAFPSRVEKYELAHKCEMDYRQIHVWFQNRRSRFRKEGKELRKRSSVLREALEKSIEDALLPLEEEDDVRWTSGAASSPLAEQQRTSAFNIDLFNVPPHAYPAPYPPLCPHEPFSDTRKFETPWVRLASTTNHTLPGLSLSISELALSFSKLSIDSESPSRVNESHPGSSGFGCGLGFVTHCPPAPLLALVRLPQRALRITRRDRVSSFTQSHGRERGQRSYCRNTTPTIRCDVQSSMKPSGSSSCRPKAGLPRRIPKNPPLNHSFPSATSPAFRRLPTLSPSRETSVGSQSLAYSSDSDSPLATPSILPINLPSIPLTQSSCTLVTSESSPTSCCAPSGEPSSLLDILRQDFVSVLFQDTDQKFDDFSSLSMLHPVC